MNELTRRVYRAQGVEIDAELGRIRRSSGEETFLRQKSHRLLLCLIEHREAPVAKADLIRLVWDGAAISDDTIVNCVQEIRKALGDDAKKPQFVRTMPKTGYWFVAALEEAAIADETEEPAASPAPEPAVAGKTSSPWRRWVWLGLGAMVLMSLAVWQWRTPREASYWEVAWWRLDEGSGGTIHESVGGATASLPLGVGWTPGISGSALSFGGGNLVVAGKDSGRLPVGPAPRTMMAWVKTNSNNADATTVFHYGHANSNENFDVTALFLHQTGRGGIHSNRSSLVGKTRLDDDRWHQIAAVIEGANRPAQLFIDGVEEASGLLDSGSLPAGPATEWSMGRAMWGGTPFRGAVDDVRVFERAMRPAELQNLYRCGSGVVDLDIPGRGGHYFAPIFGLQAVVTPGAEGESSARIRHSGNDYAGVALVRREAGCGLRSTLASDMGQDLSIELDVRLGGNGNEEVTEAGPYFRSRRSSAGDGIVGGTSAGYWVQLKSTGQVRVRRLNPSGTVAYSDVPASFDAEAFHRLAATVKGGTVTVALDGRELQFDQGGVRRTEVRIPADWETASPKGSNRGAAGIAFSSEGNRARAGGQEVRNIRVR